MLKIMKKQNERELEEENKKDPEEVKSLPKVKQSMGELRLRKDIQELDLPNHSVVKFPDEKNIMTLEVYVDLTKEDGSYWKGGKYKFTVVVPPTYPHDPPKCHCDT